MTYLATNLSKVLNQLDAGTDDYDIVDMTSRKRSGSSRVGFVPTEIIGKLIPWGKFQAANVSGAADVRYLTQSEITEKTAYKLIHAIREAESVGTGYAAEGSVTFDVGLSTSMTYTAVMPGTESTAITIEYVVAGTNTPLSLSVSGSAIVVNVATDGGGSPTSIADDLPALFAGSKAASES